MCELMLIPVAKDALHSKGGWKASSKIAEHEPVSTSGGAAAFTEGLCNLELVMP